MTVSEGNHHPYKELKNLKNRDNLQKLDTENFMTSLDQKLWVNDLVLHRKRLNIQLDDFVGIVKSDEK